MVTLTWTEKRNVLSVKAKQKEVMLYCMIRDLLKCLVFLGPTLPESDLTPLQNKPERSSYLCLQAMSVRGSLTPCEARPNYWGFRFRWCSKRPSQDIHELCAWTTSKSISLSSGKSRIIISSVLLAVPIWKVLHRISISNTFIYISRMNIFSHYQDKSMTMETTFKIFLGMKIQ